MKRLFALSLLVLVLPAFSAAADENEETVKKDRQMLAGVWRISSLTANGNQVEAEKLKQLTVINGADGTWSLESESEGQVGFGTSKFDASFSPKQVDYEVTGGKGAGNSFVGIYEIGEKTRKVCIASPGKARPTSFDAGAGSGWILLEFERVEDE